MKQKETSNEIYDISALLDEELGKEGTPERERNREKAWEEYNAQILGNDGRIAPNLTIINHGRGEVCSPEDIRCRCIRAGRPRPYNLSHNRLNHLNPHPQGVHYPVESGDTGGYHSFLNP